MGVHARSLLVYHVEHGSWVELRVQCRDRGRYRITGGGGYLEYKSIGSGDGFAFEIEIGLGLGLGRVREMEISDGAAKIFVRSML